MEILQQTLFKLMKGDISVITSEFITMCGNEAVRILNKKDLDDYDIICMSMLIQISQILYNNTDRNILVLDDGIYDLLLEKNTRYTGKTIVGAPPVIFSQDEETRSETEFTQPLTFVDDPEEYKRNELFLNDIGYISPIYPELINHNFDRTAPINGTKKTVSVPHKYPKLVGSLDKCKFTLNQEAKERGVFNDTDVKIFERDFLGKHLQMGLFGPNDEIELCLELKYDGVSVEADVLDYILSARSRGDTDADLAADLTHIFGGYKFPFCPKLTDQPFGMKFEAIMTFQNLDRMSRLKGKSYKNARNGIIGLLGTLDARNYRDLITLVPLATSMEMSRIEEIEFMNRFYHSGEKLRYSIVRGTYNQVLFQVYKFVKEAERIRPMLPFLYDGVVVSYTDPRIIQILGRKDSINKYSMAIKFNPLVRESIFTGYTYSIGQNGVITPMLHYNPVEFYGGIHTKSSGHSYARFRELNLAIGDAVRLEYTNDVMPYLTRSIDQPVWTPHNPPVDFPRYCPCCGEPLRFTDKSAYCDNYRCPERVNARITNMARKLRIKDFSSESLRSLAVSSLQDLLDTPYEFAIEALGEANGKKFIDRIEELKTKPIYDYQIVGSIGFSDIAVETWRKILNKEYLQDIMNLQASFLVDRLLNIKGIGRNTALTIATERNEFYDDLNTILHMPNVIFSKGLKSGKSIRFTGVRDSKLCTYLNSIGMDANGDANVTRKTDILIVPYDGYTSTKTLKAGPDTIIVGIDSFKANLDKYIS